MHSELMTAVPRRADVLRGYVLAAPPFLVAAEIEETLNRRHELRYVAVSVRRRMAADVATDAAEAMVVARPFSAYGRAFLRAALGEKAFTPMLLRACLVRHHPCVTIGQARALLAGGDAAFHRVRAACLDLFDVGPPGGRRGRAGGKPVRDGIDLNGITLALLKQPGVTWADVQAMTFTQAMLILFGEQMKQQQIDDFVIDAKIKWLGRFAAADGKTLRDLGRMGLPALAEWVKAKTGMNVPQDQLYPLMHEPEFSHE